MRTYGTNAYDLLQDANSRLADLGMWFGSTLFEREVRFLMNREWVKTAEDIREDAPPWDFSSLPGRRAG